MDNGSPVVRTGVAEGIKKVYSRETVPHYLEGISQKKELTPSSQKDILLNDFCSVYLSDIPPSEEDLVKLKARLQEAQQRVYQLEKLFQLVEGRAQNKEPFSTAEAISRLLKNLFP